MVNMIDTGNTAWVLLCAALVFFMTPGLALFYDGMARSKNVLGTIMQSFFLIGVISVEFILIGYTLIFGDDLHGIIGDFSKFGLGGAETAVLSDTHIPELAFVAFQCMFAVITPAIMSGSITGRMRFAPFVIFALLWSIFVYNPMAHWIWGGWLPQRLRCTRLRRRACNSRVVRCVWVDLMYAARPSPRLWTYAYAASPFADDNSRGSYSMVWLVWF